ncbi:permease prefix domain 1-containing protein [Peribacillus sp. NPDC097295]|uniref:permease prefix domain 1-containing protein n=1 Tax=Peribacillus sp. NPDC097295 TaxID=3364402 RepID=UPI00381858B3
MKTKFERYIQKIVNQTDCTKEEKEDMYEEILVHLEMSQADLIKQGHSPQQAEKMAIDLFGEEWEIGSQIQQALFPYRKELMLTLSIVSILYTFSVYSLQLFQNGDAYIGWLLFSILTSATLLSLTLNLLVSINRKIWINTALVTHTLVYLYGWGVASALDFTMFPLFSLIIAAILLLSLYLIYKTALVLPSYTGKSLRKAKRLHIFNITLGVLIMAVTIFYLYIFLIFSSEIQLFMVLFFIPAVLWISLYILQIKLLKKHPKASTICTLLQVVLVLSIVLTLFTLYR